MLNLKATFLLHISLSMLIPGVKYAQRYASEVFRPSGWLWEVGSQSVLNINVCRRSLVKKYECLHRLAATRSFQCQKCEMATYDRPGHKIDPRIPPISLSLVQIREGAVCKKSGQCDGNEPTPERKISPVTVSFTHVAIAPRISVLVFLLVTAAAKNSQSLFV